MLRLLCLASTLVALVAVGCQRSGSARDGGMQVENAVARVASSGGGAVYLKITNRTGQDDRLVSAESPSVRDARLHEVVEDGDVVRMSEAADGFPVKSGDTLVLEQGGKHLMLYDAHVEGAQLSLTLHFARAGPVTVEVPVQRGFGD